MLTVLQDDPRTQLVAPTRERGWAERLAWAVSLLQGERRTASDVARAAPIVMDSAHSAILRDALAELAGAVASLPSLSMAQGCLYTADGRIEEGLGFLQRASAIAGQDEPLLAARISFELGAVHLLRGERAAAKSALEWGRGAAGRGAPRAADLLHLQALLAESAGDYTTARDLFCATIRNWTHALTPVTGVLARVNLAVPTTHQDPAASVSLCRAAGGIVKVADIHPRFLAAARNVEGYGLICLGDFASAEEALDSAQRIAARCGQRQIELYAQFNLAIIAELRGEPELARARLRHVATVAQTIGLSALVPWVNIRLAWLLLQDGKPGSARDLVATALRPVGVIHQEAAQTLDALVASITGGVANARRPIRDLTLSYERRGDLLTKFVLLLWSAHVESSGGREGEARKALRQAAELARRCGFVLSPNWWHSDLASSARAIAGPAEADVVERLYVIPRERSGVSLPMVQVWNSGEIVVDGVPLCADVWREGRTGRLVLRRYLSLLAQAHPRGLSRDHLCDALWPESEGDAAVRNLYSATNDLRRVLMATQGVRVQFRQGTYRLALGTNAALMGVATQGPLVRGARRPAVVSAAGSDPVDRAKPRWPAE